MIYRFVGTWPEISHLTSNIKGKLGTGKVSCLKISIRWWNKISIVLIGKLLNKFEEPKHQQCTLKPLYITVIFLPKYLRKIHHSSPLRARYMMSSVGWMADLYPTIVIVSHRKQCCVTIDHISRRFNCRLRWWCLLDHYMSCLRGLSPGTLMDCGDQL